MGARWMELLQDIIHPDRETHTIPMMDGPLHPNQALDGCTIMSDAFSRPDDVVVLPDGRLLVADGNNIYGLADEGAGEPVLLHDFAAPVTGIDGFGDDLLAVCLDGVGVIFLDGTGETARLEEVDGVALKCPTAVRIKNSREVYIAQGSTLHPEANWVHDLMQKNSSGRIIRWNPETGQAEVMINDLAYPYGLTFDHDGRSLLVCESWAHVLFRMDLSAGAAPARRDVIIPNMPGYPARIIALPTGGYLLALFAMRTEMLEFVLKEDAYREEMMATIDPQYWIRPTLEPARHFLEPLQGGGFRVLGIIKPWAPPRSYGLVIELDEDYEPIRSFHSRADGAMHGVTGLAATKSGAIAAVKGNAKVIQLFGEAAK